MGPNITREEFRNDLEHIVVTAVTQAKKELIHTMNEDLAAINGDMNRRFEQVDQALDSLNDKIDFTHTLLQVHVANPSAHTRSSLR